MSEHVNHTPGPWVVQVGGLIRATDPAVGIRRSRGLAIPQVALVTDLHEERPEGERDANARLIAAAPDLLAACKAAIHYVAAGSANTVTTTKAGRIQAMRVLSQVLAAVANAEGGAS